MRRYQTDPGSARADAFVPLLLEIGRAAEAAEAAALRQAIELLAQWDRRYTRDNPRAVLFEFTMQELQSRLWDELIAPGPGTARRVATPGDAVLLQALHDSATTWWDDRRTANAVETRADVVARRSRR